MKNSSATRCALLMVVLSPILLAGGGAAVAFATGEAFVYDATIGETVPRDLDAALRDAIGDPNSPLATASTLTMRGDSPGYTVTYDLTTHSAHETCPKTEPCSMSR